MAQAPQNESHLTGSKPARTPEPRPAGAVPMRHRYRLGEDVTNDPQGAGAPSTELKIANNQRKTY